MPAIRRGAPMRTRLTFIGQAHLLWVNTSASCWLTGIQRKLATSMIPSQSVHDHRPRTAMAATARCLPV